MVDHLLAHEQVTSTSSPGTNYWALENQVNSIDDLVTYNSGTDTTSNAKHRVFDSFGNIISDTAPGVTEVFAFTGKMFDTATGLQWNWNRWYDPQLGQWVSEDPIGFSGGQENLRIYVGNQPVDAMDPTGLKRSVIETGDGWAAGWGIPIKGGGFEGKANVSVEAIEWGPDKFIAMKLQVTRNNLCPIGADDLEIKQKISRTVAVYHADGSHIYLDKEIKTSSGKYRLTIDPTKPIVQDDSPPPPSPDVDQLYYPSKESLVWYDSPSSLAGLWHEELNSDRSVVGVVSTTHVLTEVVNGT